MKLTAFLLTAALLQVFASGKAQTVSISGKDLTLRQVFSTIESQTGYVLFTNREMLEGTRPVSLKVTDMELTALLDVVLKGQQLDYIIQGKTITLSESAARRRMQRYAMPPGLEVFAAPPIPVRITGPDGKPLAGATIQVKGTGITGVTNADGVFDMELQAGQTITVSFIGYESREVVVTPVLLTRSFISGANGKPNGITIALTPKVESLGETVVLGIYNRPKESFTGAVTTISGQQLRSVNGLNVLQALKVFDASIHIPENVQYGSDPNRLPTITMRGTNNFPTQGGNSKAPVSGADFSSNYMSNPNQPLFILDGFEVSIQKINDLDMSRIASFTILKDAAATSIYGSRAANGVIVVETVQPKPGKLRLSYSGQAQVTAPDLTVYDLTNAAEKLEVERLAGVYSRYSDGAQAGLDAYYRQLYSNRLTKVQRGVNTYWLSKPVHTGFGQRHSIYLEGGDNYVRYGIDFGYNNNAGVMKNSGRNNYTGGMNLSYRHKGLLIKNVLSVAFNKAKNSNYGSFSEYSQMNPYWEPFDENGNALQVVEQYTIQGSKSTPYLNPLYNATLHIVDQSTYTGITNQTNLEWRINDAFRAVGKLAINKQTDQSDKFLPAKHNSFYEEDDFTERGSYTQTHSQFFSYDGSLQLDYNKQLGNGYLYNTTGVNIAETNSDYVGVTVTGFPNERMNDIGFGNGYPANTKPDGGNAVTRRISAFSNFNYTYDSRFLADVSFRADGSSQFGVNKRFAPFWSAGLGWNVHNEKFFRQSAVVNRLRIRASMGSTGDNRFPPFMGITSYKYYTDQNYRSKVGAVLMGYGNENLAWQQTIKQNLGTDLTMFNTRLNLTFNIYRENTNGLILDINTPPSDGVTSYKENVGKLQNNGYEFNATYFIVKNEKSQRYWSFFVNGNHNRNYIKSISNSLKKLNQTNDKNDEGQQTKPQYRFEEGQSTNVIWAVRSNGIDPSNGREVYVKKDGKLTYDWDPKDKVITGDITPDLNGNFGTNITLHGFTLGVYFDFQFGGQAYNQTLQSRVEGADLQYQVDRRLLLGRWTKPGDVKYFQRLIYASNGIFIPPSNATSRFVQNNNYLNLGSISLGYQIPDRVTRRWGLSNTRLGFIANEVKRWSTIKMERGLDYPFARNFTFNITTSINQ
ncbi:SusC/RagA family TonB-linked outer membrane protein [Chitinophaga caseinilytica]|uniref:SusC/RagA family TonB-linked outer membrane protein n=1 Tax=Chitinophaga caseinilytica TaxID=2267521 RepID=UPI003C2D6273